MNKPEGMNAPALEVTEVERLRTKVAQLERQLAAHTGPPWINDVLKVFGWQGGTWTQVVDEVTRLVSSEAARSAQLKGVVDTSLKRGRDIAIVYAAALQEFTARIVEEQWWPPTLSGACCASCGAWTPAGDPEAHNHGPACPALAEFHARRSRALRIRSLATVGKDQPPVDAAFALAYMPVALKFLEQSDAAYLADVVKMFVDRAAARSAKEVAP